MQTEWTPEIRQALLGPFSADQLDFKPGSVSNGQAMAMAYIDARDVMTRLDDVVGPGGWSFTYDVIAGPKMMIQGCLTVLGVAKCDAGEADREEETLKSAVSDALKRCAVHVGIGRYLYNLPRVWAPYDQQKRRFTEKPQFKPADVARALSLVGYTGLAPQEQSRPQQQSRPAPNAAPRPAAAPSSPSTSERVTGALETQPSWSGVSGYADTRPHDASPEPESGGDRAVTTGQPALPVDPNPTGMQCSNQDCKAALTKGQHDVSLRAFGQPLCPKCQKAQARNAA